MLSRIYTGAMLIGLLSALLAAPIVQARDYDEGIEYQRVTPPVRPSGQGKVEVVELFWYGCPHCYSFEPKLVAWKKKKANNINFVRIPAIFNNRPLWELHARAYYTADLLGILDKIHGPLFDAIQKDRKRMANLDGLANFFAQYNVDRATFKDTMSS